MELAWSIYSHQYLRREQERGREKNYFFQRISAISIIIIIYFFFASKFLIDFFIKYYFYHDLSQTDFSAKIDLKVVSFTDL